MNQVQILAYIYKILAESDADTLEQLIKSGNQPKSILSVIQAFNDAKIALDAKKNGLPDKRKVGHKRASKATSLGDLVGTWSPQAKRLWTSTQTAFSDKKKYKLSNKMFLEAFLNSGLETSARYKEGKKKMLLLIETSLHALDDPKRISVLENALSHLGLSQTKGYMEVIRSRNPQE